MDPRDVESAADVRSGWAGWGNDQKRDALGALANANLVWYGYDGVDVYSEKLEGVNGLTDDTGIYLDSDVLESPDADWVIHITDHETVHVMDEQDGIDSSVSPSFLPPDHLFTEDEATSVLNHMDVGDQARVLDHDGYLDRSAPRSGGRGGGGRGGGFDGSGDGAGGTVPQSDELTFEIDWASGVWIDTTAADGTMSVDLYFAPMEGW